MLLVFLGSEATNIKDKNTGDSGTDNVAQGMANFLTKDQIVNILCLWTIQLLLQLHNSSVVAQKQP